LFFFAKLQNLSSKQGENFYKSTQNPSKLTKITKQEACATDCTRFIKY